MVDLYCADSAETILDIYRSSCGMMVGIARAQTFTAGGSSSLKGTYIVTDEDDANYFRDLTQPLTANLKLPRNQPDATSNAPLLAISVFGDCTVAAYVELAEYDFPFEFPGSANLFHTTI